METRKSIYCSFIDTLVWVGAGIDMLIQHTEAHATDNESNLKLQLTLINRFHWVITHP